MPLRSFDGATASEPVLECWDDDDLDSYDYTCLGAGTASSSWVKAVCTTTSSPGADWTGTTMAGSGSGYYLELNDGNGALTEATDLYWQMKIPAKNLLGAQGNQRFLNSMPIPALKS